MASAISLEDAQKEYPDYTFIAALTPSAQKAAFHVRNSDGRDLCLKIILPDYDLDRLSREILAFQTSEHPNIVKLIEYTNTTKDGKHRHFIVEEFIAGTDLTALLPSGKCMPLKTAVKTFLQLCEGLAALRKADIVHRDLKPSNIRVRDDGSLVIIDFGISRHLKLPALTDTRDGAQLGTPLYFSPEQFDGTKYDIDHRTDLFAVGVMLFEALTGSHPFYKVGMSREKLHSAVCSSEEYKENSHFKALPEPWQLLIQKLLAKQRANRPVDAAQVRTILLKFGASS